MYTFPPPAFHPGEKTPCDPRSHGAYLTNLARFDCYRLRSSSEVTNDNAVSSESYNTTKSGFGVCLLIISKHHALTSTVQIIHQMPSQVMLRRRPLGSTMFKRAPDSVFPLPHPHLLYAARADTFLYRQTLNDYPIYMRVSFQRMHSKPPSPR